MTQQKELPEPLVPADLDLSDFKYMPLYLHELRRSKAWSIAKRQPEVGFYMVNLWGESWFEVPAGSLPDDDELLADLAMCQADRWPEVRVKVLHGWVKCSDGRWYHPFICEKAVSVLEAKSKRRNQTAAAREARLKNRQNSPAQNLASGPRRAEQPPAPPTDQAKGVARGIIAAFDEVQERVFAAARRPYPHNTDLVTAVRWIEEGADLDTCRSVFEATMPRWKQSGKTAPISLKQLNLSMGDAIAAQNQQLPETGNVNLSDRSARGGRTSGRTSSHNTLFDAGAELAAEVRDGDKT